LKSDILMVHCVRMYIHDINKKILNCVTYWKNYSYS